MDIRYTADETDNLLLTHKKLIFEIRGRNLMQARTVLSYIFEIDHFKRTVYNYNVFVNIFINEIV